MKIRTFLLYICIFVAFSASAQNVYLSRVEKTIESPDKHLILINPETTPSEYLGIIDVQGFSNDDAAMFSRIYQKAKEIGANGFAFQPFETVDEKIQPFDASHYRIKLFFVAKEEITKPSAAIYLFSSATKSQKININRKDYVLQPRSFTTLNTEPGEIYTISTKKILGSTIKVPGTADSQARYFQISATKVRTNTTGEPGINLKSGDILVLERSYGDFLRMIYTENK